MARNSIDAKAFNRMFDPTERAILTSCVWQLATKDFQPVTTEEGAGGPLFGLTNERVQATRALLESGPRGRQQKLDLYVLYTAALEAEVPMYTQLRESSALETAALPIIQQICGKLQKARGFKNPAVTRLLTPQLLTSKASH